MVQPISKVDGDAAALIAEMKRRARVDTDTQLARILETTQSNVSTWKKRKRVPESVLLRFDRLNLAASSTPELRIVAARALALKAAELAKVRVRKGGKAGETVVFMTFATAWDAVVRAIAADLERKERDTRRWSTDIVGELVESDAYVGAIVDWAMSLPMSDIASLGAPKLPQ